MKQRVGREAGISEEELAIFGLTSAEAKIALGLIELGPTGVSKLSRETRLPHTTVHSAVRRLREQGLVRRVSKGYRSVWKVVRVESIRKKLNIALKPLEGDVTRETLGESLGVKVPETTEFFVFRGIDSLLRVYQWFFLNHRNDCVCGIQTAHSSESIYKKLNYETVAQLNDAVKTNKIIMDAILPESIMSFYRQNVAQNRRLASSIEGRTTSVHLIPDKLLSFNADMVIARDTAFLANWEEETLILIKNPDFITLLQNMFEFLKQAGTPFDQNAYMRQLINDAEREK